VQQNAGRKALTTLRIEFGISSYTVASVPAAHAHGCDRGISPGLCGLGLARGSEQIAARLLRPGRTDCPQNAVLPGAWLRLTSTSAGGFRCGGEALQGGTQAGRDVPIKDDQTGWYDVPAGLIGLADSLAGRGHFDEAEPLYMRALAIRKEAYGWDNPGVAEVLEHHAASLQRAGRTADRDRLESQAKAIRAKQRRE